MLLSELSTDEVLKMEARITLGEKIFAVAIQKNFDIEKGSIVEIVGTRLGGMTSSLYPVIYGRKHRAKNGTILSLESFELAPDATKTWSPEQPKVVLPEPEAPRIFDGLGQEVNIGDILALKDEGHLLFVRYESYKGVNTLMFRDVRRGQNVKRMPGGLCRRHRSYTFDHSVKISDKPTLDRIMLNKLTA